MKIKHIFGSLLLLVGAAFGQQFSGGGSGVQTSGAVTAGHCVQFIDAAHIQDAGGACTTGGSGINVQVNGGANIVSPANLQNGTAGNIVNFSLSGSNVQATLQAASVTNAMLVNNATTVNGQTCTLGTTCALPFATNSVANTSVAGINFINSTVNGAGLVATFSNPATNQDKLEITGTYSGSGASITAGTIATAALATVQGNGAKVQLSTGTTTLNDCAKFDTNGNIVDAGAACGSGGSLNVNGSPVAAPNLNGTTPAAGANGINATFQVSGSNISAELVGDGNAAHCLSGAGTYVTCSGGVSGLTAGQRISASTPTTLVSSGPIYDTTQITGATFAARIATCLAALPVAGGTCDASAEAVTTTTATITVSGTGQLLIMPPVHITLGNTFTINVTGSFSGLVCLQKWQCELDAHANGSAGTVALTGTQGDFLDGFYILGGRLNSQTGTELVAQGLNHKITNNWVQQAGNNGIVPRNCNACFIQYNIIDQSANAAIIVTANTSGLVANNNDIGFNTLRDNNTANTTQGQIGTVCPTASGQGCDVVTHGADGNSFHDNVVFNQVLGSGDCNNPNLGPNAIASVSGTGAVVTLTFTTPLSGTFIYKVGQTVALSGFTGAWVVINGNQVLTASSTTTISFSNATTGTTSTGSVTYVPTTSDTGCSEAFQLTDTSWNNVITNNRVYNSSKEGYAFSGNGNKIIGNSCDACDLYTATPGGAFSFTHTTSANLGDSNFGNLVVQGNTVTNSSAQQVLYGFTVVGGAAGTASWTAQNIQYIGNHVDVTRICMLISYSINGSNVGTFNCTNAFATSDVIVLGGFATSTFLNGVSITVTSATGTSFVGAITHATTGGTVTENGQGVQVGFAGSGGIQRGYRIVNTQGAGTVTLYNVRLTGNTAVVGNTAGNAKAWDDASYTGFSGAVKLTANGLQVINGTLPTVDTKPTVGDCVQFDANGQPESDASGPCTTAAATLTSTAIVTGAGAKGVQTPSATSTLSSGGNMSLAGSLTAATGVTATTGGLNATSDGTHSGLLSLVGNTTAPTGLPSNSFGLVGPNSASFTSYFLQFSSTAPSGGQVPSCATPASNISACTWVSNGGVSSVNTLTGAVVIEAATAGQMAVSGGASAALTGAADMTYTTHTFATTTAGIFDWSAATGTNAFKLPAVIGGTSLAGTSTASLSAPIEIKNTNSSNNNTSIAMIVNSPGTSTGQIGLLVNGAATGSDLQQWTTGGTVTNGVISAQTKVASVNIQGAFLSGGTTAGYVDYAQGTTSVAQTLCATANSICEQAPTAVTSYLVNKPGVAASGTLFGTNASAVITQGFSGDTNHSTSVTTGSGTSIGSTSLCSTTFCPAGTYRVNVYTDITTACGTSGTYVVNLIYTDDQGSKTVPVNLEGTGSVPATGVLTTTSTANFGYDSFVLRSTGSASINYSTTAAACGTAGPMVGKLYLSVEPLQ